MSPRMRLDVVVNLLTMHALTHNCVKLLGGAQMRPNIHIEDMTNLYVWMLNRPHLSGVFNAGFENMSVREIGNIVAGKLGCRTVALPSEDPRSYRQNSDKLLAAGFKPRHTVENAVDEIIAAFREGKLRDNNAWYNLRSTPRKAA